MIYFKIILLIACIAIAVTILFQYVKFKREINRFNDDTQTTLEEAPEVLSKFKKFIYLMFAVIALGIATIICNIFSL